LLVLVPALPLARAWFLWADATFLGASGLLVVGAVASLVLWALLPRAFELWPDRVRFVLGGPFTVSVDLDSIEGVEAAPGVRAILPIRWGAIFATSFKTTVRLRRAKGVSYMVSPNDPAGFSEAVGAALAKRRYGGRWGPRHVDGAGRGSAHGGVANAALAWSAVAPEPTPAGVRE
jgi:hypothetical protein